jgi:hypothetical protein
MMDNGAQKPNVQYLYGNHGSICGRYRWESSAHYPGRSCQEPETATDAERQRDKWQEVSRGHSRRTRPR